MPQPILNWRRVDARLTLSGQPSEAQLGQIAALGVTHLVNLGPHDNRSALRDEPGTVAALRMEYHYIPVDFQAPSEADFSRFCEVMDRLAGQTIHVHCIYNARVSAFMYRYRRDVLKEDPALIRRDLHQIWEPFGVWKDFIRA